MAVHSAGDFTHLVYFCTPSGECTSEQVPEGDIRAFQSMLNERGKQGWELVQLVFGKDGVISVWKREI
jgi:hypothetical protein